MPEASSGSDAKSALTTYKEMHGDLLMLNARETKPPGEKMIGFFRWCATAFGTVESDGEDDPADRGGFDRGLAGEPEVHLLQKAASTRKLVVAWTGREYGHGAGEGSAPKDTVDEYFRTADRRRRLRGKTWCGRAAGLKLRRW